MISEEISCTVENIAKGASEQAGSTEIGSQNADKLGMLIEKNQEHVIDLNSSTERVKDLVNSGLLDVERLSTSTKENRKATEEICEIITRTKKSSQHISEASNMISEMARQTNLLALNATIEAARAGEAGKGFAIVAEEIQKMADQSAASTNYIDDIINQLQQDVQNSLKSMERIKVTSDGQQKSVMETIQNYQSIADSMKVSEAAVMKINESEEDMNSAKNEIINMLESLSAIAEQNAAGTQQAASFVVEQSISARILADTSSRLSELADNLQTIIDRVRV
jgi:methyl-accepting chemotaxis protein